MNTPPLHHPNMRDDTNKEGMHCFLNSERVCGADCMAFVAPIEKPDHSDFIGKEWAQCHLLINAHRVGKHVAILAVTADSLLKKVKTYFADKERGDQVSPQEPQ